MFYMWQVLILALVFVLSKAIHYVVTYNVRKEIDDMNTYLTAIHLEEFRLY